MRWLRAASRSSRVAVIGIGLGGLLAIEATRSGAPIDDLVLWAVPAGGRATCESCGSTQEPSCEPTRTDYGPRASGRGYRTSGVSDER